MMKSLLCSLALAALMATGAQAAPAVKAAGSHAALPCDACHKNGQLAAPKNDACFACHQSYEAVAERTKAMNPNPHFSHRGEANCTNCHSMHAKPRFECNDCHTFDIKMKGE